MARSRTPVGHSDGHIFAMINWGEKKLKATGPFRTTKAFNDAMASFGMEGSVPLPGYRRFNLPGTNTSVGIGLSSRGGHKISASLLLNGEYVNGVDEEEEQWRVAELLSAMLEDIFRQ